MYSKSKRECITLIHFPPVSSSLYILAIFVPTFFVSSSTLVNCCPQLSYWLILGPLNGSVLSLRTVGSQVRKVAVESLQLLLQWSPSRVKFITKLQHMCFTWPWHYEKWSRWVESCTGSNKNSKIVCGRGATFWWENLLQKLSRTYFRKDLVCIHLNADVIKSTTVDKFIIRNITICTLHIILLW
jgi:hypothetical protein